jgi:hypothetical protein
MRACSCGLLSLVLAGCTGHTIDAGANPGSSASAGDGGPTVVASSIQLVPTSLVSDGTSLFWWSSADASGLSSVPIAGGAIVTVVPGPIATYPPGYMQPNPLSPFLAVDGANVYYPGPNGIYRAPKGGGGSPVLVNETSDAGVIIGWTMRGADLYWMEAAELGVSSFLLKRAPLQGGAASISAQGVTVDASCVGPLAVTATTVFASLLRQPGVESFPLGLDGGSPAQVWAGMDNTCSSLISDDDAAYCLSLVYLGSAGVASTIERLTNDGTTLALASGPSISDLAIDGDFVYWTEQTAPGAVRKVPKAGGPSVLVASDDDPVAVAVDARAVYWSDVGGNIMRLAK